MDGTHLISRVGAPQSVQVLQLGSKEAPTTSPVILPNADTLLFAIAQGNTISVGSTRSCRILARSTDQSPITELVADSVSLYALHLNGAVEKFSLDGKLEWHTIISGLPKLGSILTTKLLITSTDSAVVAINTSDGSAQWQYHSTLHPVSLCQDPKSSIIYVALTANDATASDTISCLTPEGTSISRTGFAKTRITSNLCLIAGGIAFGYLSGADTTSQRKTARLCYWSGVTTFAPKRTWDHALPYIVSSVSSNGKSIISGGFRETEGEIISGIDAFAISDSATLWKRRFSYPLVSVVTVSPAYAYIPFTFSTQATISTKTVLSTIDLSDGKTYNELPIDGAMTGFAQGVAIPAEGMLMYADRSLPQVYFLKP